MNLRSEHAVTSARWRRALLALLLSGCAMTAHSADGAEGEMPSLAPGASLQALLDGEPAAAARFALDGAPPGPTGVLPEAPASPGPHWLLRYDAAGEIQAWHRFNVTGSAASATTLRLAIDRHGPELNLRWDGPTLQREGQTWVGPDSQPRLDSHDGAGVAERSIRIDRQRLDDSPDWAAGRRSGALALRIEARDALGNAHAADIADIRLDRDSPTLRWRRLDPVEGVAEDIFDGDAATLSIEAEDAGAGLRRLQVGEQSSETNTLQLTVSAEETPWQTEDAVGNRSSGSIALRADREGPSLRIEQDGAAVDLRAARLQRDRQLSLLAEDPLAGVQSACVEASIWYDECRPLPIQLKGIAPGRYVLKLRAVDRLGNRSHQRSEIEVLP